MTPDYRRTWAMAGAGLLEPHEYMHLLRRPRRRKPPPADGLRTPDEAAAKLRCSIKTLNGYVDSGALSYVAIGHGTKRQRKLFADADIDTFIANQTRKDVPACPSSARRTRLTSTSTSSSEVIAFTAR